ncbi:MULTISPECIES: VanZ family protein [Bacillaceae]|uniref:VanZ family protein n=1 Tax=Bacillaceae TaxID=186817 RepID=UPI00159BEFE1|nr:MULTISPECIES: VanZ family protein [Bacillaceae]UGB30717.1 VanZ family protein [Metabacillus sp. B2-18]
MKGLLVCFAILLLCLFTFTESLSLLLSQQKVSFHYEPHPAFSSFLHNDLMNLQDLTYRRQKLGHFSYFFFLAILIYWAWRRHSFVFIMTLGAAFLTEIGQLFFSRSGRLLDVGYDMAGVCLFYLLYGCYRGGSWLYTKVNDEVSVNRQ